MVARPAAPNAAPSPGDLAGLNARMRAMLPHGDVDTMAHYGAPAMDAPDLDLVAEYVPAEVLAETFGLIRITRSVMHAGSTTYVFEHKKDIFGREVCRALRFTPHPLRTPPPRWDPNHGITWADRNPDLKPEVDYLDVSCSDPRIEAVTPGSLDRPQRSGGARATENAPTGAAVPAASPTP
ncbi:MAG TPA: hypothetical protein VFB22_04550 [Candidatus Baltobacteraceae bacterium]|nr:hypothetical protein [Candidatus Baltobacteraceae bacterium]